MGFYTYKLHKDNIEEKNKKTYKEKNLRLMTTFQLREICNREKLVKSIVNPLDKEELIKLILKYRGEEDSLLINSYEEDGIKRVQEFLDKSSKELEEGEDIDYPGKLILYKDLSLETYDYVNLRTKEDLEEGNVLLVDNALNICSILNVKKVRNKYFLTRDKSIELRDFKGTHYSLLLLSNKDSELIYHIYHGQTPLEKTNMKIKKLKLLSLEIREVEETKIPLAIDFGTSNTTAGIFVDREIFNDLNETNMNDNHKVKLVHVYDTTSEDLKLTPLIPSIVGVKKVQDGKVDYIFGYEALEESKKRYIDDGLTIFYDIKRWVSDYEKEEKVVDANESTCFIKRKDIIKAYLLYVISLANTRFKCKFKNIYISCPSKQKYKFHSLFKEILKDYTVESENILEESVAVLYNTISDLIERKKYRQGEWYKALIIDCGGGTTDLSGCSFSIKNNRVSYSLDIETSYENGDTDFGGNNLTFRIMQFIKILMAKALIKEDLTVKKAIIDEFNIDIFRFVDKEGITALYETLNEEYEKTESIIPTKFKLYETRSKEDYCKVRSNYYFLFNLAERVKKLFFSNPDLLKVTLTSNEHLSSGEDVIRFDKWKLSYIHKNKLEVVKEAPEISLNTYEITTLIKGDVYSIIKKFLESLYENDELYDYSLIKLTGQSCKVDIFRDALKEFIPGRVIEVNKSKKEAKEEYELKLACIKGALKYLYARNFGYADINIESRTPSLPYKITAFTHTGEERALIDGKDIRKGSISRFMERILLKLYLKDSNETVKYEYNYTFNEEDLEKTDAYGISDEYRNIDQHETDNIENDEVKFFVWAEEELWGFYVLAILRRDDELYKAKEKFFYFENDEWEKNFFDGLK
mgnify:CR=1 FL=1